MKFIQILLFLFVIIGTSVSHAQITKRQLEIVKTSIVPKIDGKLDDETWKNAAIADKFFQYVPVNGIPSLQKSLVRIAYDDNAFYVGAMLYDNNPDSIATTMSKRDTGFDDDADVFIVALCPFNDGINMSMFGVSAAGVQSDIKGTSGDDDSNWDAVWKSEISIVDSGWIIEMEIPYSELRFSKSENQVWGFNIYRKITRINEWSSWNFIDNKIEGISNQTGEITGLKNLQPPLRLSFTPYLSVFAENESGENIWTRGVRGGLDLKYGINESFTLDLMLIPDFAQVQTDDQILNLSPFEVQYQERRPFFTEGTELFNKGGIFYSKRIGGFPRNYWDVEDGLVENEEVTKNPSESQIINATKVSGRTKKGLGIGFFNAMILKSIAKITDTLTGVEREYVTQPFTNYNILVFDQNLKNNSYFSVINTNMYMPDNEYTSNVSALDFRLKNKNQTYTLRGKAALSQIYEKDADAENGYKYDIHFEKTSGNFQFELTNEIADDKFNPNDMGYLSFNNYIRNQLELRYKILKPHWKFVEFGTELNFAHTSQYKPVEYMNFEWEFDTYMTFKNYWNWGFFIGGNPFGINNFHEPRVEGKVYKEPAGYYTGSHLGSDRRKKVYFNAFYVHWNSFSEYDQNMNRFEFYPTWRASDKFKIGLGTEFEISQNSLGYVNDFNDSVYFGKRNRKTYNISLNCEYTFNPKSIITFRARHYWSSAKYDQYYFLNTNGNLTEFSEFVDNEDINFNAFNIDMVYTWRFAPGSELIAVWKNAIYVDGEDVIYNYGQNLKNTINAPQNNHFSIKVLYYLDYKYLKRQK